VPGSPLICQLAGFTVFMVALTGRDAVDRFASEVIPLVRGELARMATGLVAPGDGPTTR
jgi:hypothetical protein